MRLLVLIAIFFVLSVMPAAASTGVVVDARPADDKVEIEGSSGGGGVGVEVGGSGGGGGGAEVELVRSFRLVTAPDGSPCVAEVLVPLGQELITPLPNGYPLCPPAVAPDPAPGPSPAEWVEEFLDRSAPERPEPSFIPPFGITGERMYLVTEAETSWDRQVTDTPFGALALTGTAEITVDWGDDTITGPHAEPGLAWPDGEINHVWQFTGTYDIVVTYSWDIEWAFAGTSGTLTLDQTTTLAEYPVIEVQPVIRYP